MSQFGIAKRAAEKLTLEPRRSSSTISFRVTQKELEELRTAVRNCTPINQSLLARINSTIASFKAD